jgi:protein-S-isoprenylcysteine O-methyltransferase Ste14
LATDPGRARGVPGHVPVPWVYVIVYFVGVALEHAFPPGLSPETQEKFFVAGVVLFLLGCLVAGWGWTLFHRARTTTIPGRASTTLVTWGPYRFTRNPMYVGLALGYLGEAGLLKHVWPIPLLLVVLAYVNWLVIPIEEARLHEVFGAEYDAYKARVRRWL